MNHRRNHDSMTGNLTLNTPVKETTSYNQNMLYIWGISSINTYKKNNGEKLYHINNRQKRKPVYLSNKVDKSTKQKTTGRKKKKMFLNAKCFEFTKNINNINWTYNIQQNWKKKHTNTR